MISIYDDGIHNNSALHTIITKLFPTVSCHFIASSSILNNDFQDTKLLIFPGGADLYFGEKLNGIGNKNIKSFIKNGGAYLGICAGAYYACDSLDWNNGEIAGKRELSLFSGTAKGPVFDWVENRDDVYNGSWLKAVRIKTDTHEFFTEYNGGPLFSEPIDKNAQVLARYSDIPSKAPALISGQYGKGKYILSSAHIERFGHVLSDNFYKNKNPSHHYEKKEIALLLEDTEQQKMFFTKIINTLLKE